MDHREFGVERPVSALVDVTVLEGSVVRDRPRLCLRGRVATGCARRTADVALVEAVAFVDAGSLRVGDPRWVVGVVGLPRGVRGLVDDLGRAAIVTDHERNLARAAGVVADQERYVETGDGVARHLPGRGCRPVPTIDQSGGWTATGIDLTCRLGLGEADRRQDVRCPLSAAETLVVAQPEDVDVPGGDVRGVNLEVDGLSDIDAHRSGEALDGRIADAVVGDAQGSVGDGRTRLQVLALHRVHLTRAPRRRWHRRCIGTVVYDHGRDVREEARHEQDGYQDGGSSPSSCG